MHFSKNTGMACYSIGLFIECVFLAFFPISLKGKTKQDLGKLTILIFVGLSHFET